MSKLCVIRDLLCLITNNTEKYYSTCFIFYREREINLPPSPAFDAPEFIQHHNGDEDESQNDEPIEANILPDRGEPCDPILSDDVDTRFWLMVVRWMVRGKFGYVELAELMVFLFSSNIDVSAITLRTVPMFKRFDQAKQEACSRGRWKHAEVGGELRVTFGYREGREAVEALYGCAANFVDNDFEWTPNRVVTNGERVYSTPATGLWWGTAQVSVTPLSTVD